MITWYKLKIKKQINEYECYIRFKFDPQMQSIKIKSFIYLTDSEGNICVTEEKNKLGYDPRILGSLTVEKNFLKNKRKSNSKINYEVMKYQGNFNICNLPLIDGYFKNGKALIYQYKELIYLMDNKKYKIQIGPKKFTIILDVINYGNICLNLYNKLEDVEKQELIFLRQNESALCHRYLSNKFQENQMNRKEEDEIKVIEENKNFNQLGGRICIGKEEGENMNLEEDKEQKEEGENENNFINFNNNDDDADSDDSSVYDSIFFTNGEENNEKLSINNKFFQNLKELSNENQNISFINNNILNYNEKRVNKSKNKNKIFNYNFNNINSINSIKNINNINNINGINNINNFNNINNINSINNINKINNINNNEKNNTLFIKLKKEGNTIINHNKINIFINQNITTNSNSKKDLNFLEKAKNIVNKYGNQKDINITTTEINYSLNQNHINFNNKINGNKINLNSICNKTISEKGNMSLLLNQSEQNILLYSTGFDNNKYNLQLIYKSTINGDNIHNFHKSCDNRKNIFIMILTLDNTKLGFYTSVGLSSDNKNIYDDNAFLFKLDKTEMDCFHIKNGEIAFYGYDDYVLYLGGDQLIIRDNFMNRESLCGMKMKNYRINTNYQLNNGNQKFIIKELEIYIISKI